jgi:cobalt-precorrin 5A hydrolase
MKIALFAYSQTGIATARAVMETLSGQTLDAFTAQRLADDRFSAIPSPSAPFFAEIVSRYDALVFVCSCGIAVRCIAPHLRDKAHDPAVICMDELGHFVIPILSGHIGGANELARRIAAQMQAVPVITTATDVHRKFSADAWAAANGYVIDDLKAAKMVSAAILERPVPMLCDLPLRSAYPDGIVPGSEGELGILVSYRRVAPFSTTLRLIPRILHLGVGCRKGTEESVLERAVFSVLDAEGIDYRAVKCVASIDLKAREPGLLRFCEKHDLKPAFYSAQQLSAVPGAFTASAFVQDVTGVDNVCERAALLGAERLIVNKTAIDGVTVAIAAERMEVNFG